VINEGEVKIPANILAQLEGIMEIEEAYNEYIRDLVSDEIEEVYNEYIRDLVSDGFEDN